MNSNELIISKILHPGITTPQVIRWLGVQHRNEKGVSFWLANEDQLHSIYHDFEKAARKVLAENHPDAGGNNEEFIKLNKAFLLVKRVFNRRGIPESDAIKFVKDKEAQKQRGLATTRSRSAHHNRLRYARRLNPANFRPPTIPPYTPITLEELNFLREHGIQKYEKTYHPNRSISSNCNVATFCPSDHSDTITDSQ